MVSPVQRQEALHPLKRRRVFMDAVVLPLLSKYRRQNVKAEAAVLEIKPEPLNEDDKIKLEALRNNVSFPSLET